MSRLFSIFGDDDDRIDDDRIEETEDDATLRLREEQLNVAKNRVQAGEVEISKEIIEEEKSIDVPVTHEEVVIERRAISNEVTDDSIEEEETIRIPVSEEKIDIDKRTVITGEISAHKREIEDTEHIQETIKKEKARVNSTGNTKIIDDYDDHGDFS
jgi:uncharacterized protein (TIGR02271 family)